MTIDEAIASERNQHEFSDYNNYHEQLAEWLGELKELRHEANEWRKVGYIHGYNKAIDDFAEELCKAFDETTLNDDGYYPNNVVRSIAEQIKEGKENER